MTKKLLDDQEPGEIEVLAREENIGKVVGFVSDYAGEMLFSEKRIGEIGLALKEALGNIIHFACPAGTETIRVTCQAHETGAVILNIIDTGRPFNMLVMSTFPETAEGDGPVPSTAVMKRHIRDVEYRRDGEGKRNILAWVISK